MAQPSNFSGGRTGGSLSVGKLPGGGMGTTHNCFYLWRVEVLALPNGDVVIHSGTGRTGSGSRSDFCLGGYDQRFQNVGHGVCLVGQFCPSLGSARKQLPARQPAETLVLAATWALVAAEIAWVLQAWLVTYVVAGQTLLVPQPVLVLTGVAYCFGSIFAAQRRGRLSRGRLLEYMTVGLVVLVIVVVGTSWRASL